MGNQIAKCDGAFSTKPSNVNFAHDTSQSDKKIFETASTAAASAKPTDTRPDEPYSSAQQSKKFELNPGTVEEFHKKCKEIFPMCFEGGKFMVQKGLSNHFQINHTINLTPMSTGYRFGATYVGTKLCGPQEAFPVLFGDTDISGNVAATVIHQFGDRLRCKAATQVQKGRFAGAQVSADYKAPTWTASGTVANLDLVNESGILVLSYLRRVTRGLDLGIEHVYQYAKQIPGGHLSTLDYLARYTGERFVTSAQAGRQHMHFSYYHKHSDTVQFGVEWETSFRMGESTATFGYQLDIPKTGVVFRASVDSNWTVASTLEKRLNPLPFTLSLSSMLNHTKSQSRFGIGLAFG